MSNGVDLDLIRRAALRSPAFSSPDSVRPQTAWSMLDAIPEHVASSRPVVIAAVLSELLKADPGLATMVVGSGIAQRLRSEIAVRKESPHATAAPLVVRQVG